MYSYLRERDDAFDYGRYRPAGEGAREAWAMVNTRYTKLDPNHMARVGTLGSDGKEIPISLVYDQVQVGSKNSQQDCRLDSMLHGIEEEVLESK